MERVRAIIIKDHQILLIKRTKGKKVYWIIPGGGIEIGEDHERALQRECMEELGVTVKVGKLLFEGIADHPDILGQKLFYYSCRITGGMLGTGNGPEFQPGGEYVGSFEVEWIDMDQVANINLQPDSLKKLLRDLPQ